ncbi:MAG: hypothetical protein M3198_18420 [Actinomycetota bacterium]|nr:hypothetical protein [Actinomycetota bacterium]
MKQDIYEAGNELEARLEGRAADSVKTLGAGLLALNQFLAQLQHSGDAEPERRGWALDSFVKAAQSLGRKYNLRCTIGMDINGPSVSFTPLD